MKPILIKGKYQWQYVIIALILAMLICGSLIWWKFGADDSGNAVDKTVPITSTTAPERGISDVIGKEPSRAKTTTTTNITTKSNTDSTTWNIPSLPQDANNNSGNIDSPADDDKGNTRPKVPDNTNNKTDKPLKTDSQNKGEATNP
ncbi:MAG: hypothetical protein RR069_02255 [Oscillospiraceae bacterium]